MLGREYPVKSFMANALLKDSNRLVKKQQEELIRKETALKESEGIVCLVKLGNFY